VLKDKSVVAVRVEHGSDFRAAELVWKAKDGLDVVLLKTEKPLAQDWTSVSFMTGAIQGGQRWETRAYPEVFDGNTHEGWVPVSGDVHNYNAGEPKLLLDTNIAADIWGGISGAAVVINDHILGIIRATHDGWNNRRIDATPCDIFVFDKDFIAELGSEERNQHRERFRAWLINSLKQQQNLCIDIAEILFNRNATEEEVASALTRCSMTQLLDVLSYCNIMSSLSKNKARLSVFKRLFNELLVFSVDYEQEINNAIASSKIEKTVFDWPIQTETFAEIIMAGIDARQCAFQEGTKSKPRGISSKLAGDIGIIAAPIADPSGQQFAEATRHYFKEIHDLNSGNRFSEQVRKEIASDENVEISEVNLCLEEIKNETQNLVKWDVIDQIETPPYYLIVSEGGERWELVCSTLTKMLPSLRLVHLKGKALGKEVKDALRINRIVVRLLRDQ